MASTALVRDLKRKHGDNIKLAYDTNQPEILANNPYLEPVSKQAEIVKLDYSEGLRLSRGGTRHHFITWFHRFWSQVTGLSVPLTEPWPDLHLSEELKRKRPIKGNYWLVFAGGKKDCSLKYWDFNWYEEVVEKLQRSHGIWCAQSGAIGLDHVHPVLNSPALNLLGWGGLTELMWQIYHCQGVICPITCAMHMAAAFNKPCVVIAGGREEPWWEAYDRNHGQFGLLNEAVIGRQRVEHKFLHTLGRLPCCELVGCGRVHVKDVNYDQACVALADRSLGRQMLPKCMELIQPSDVVQAVCDYVMEYQLPTHGSPPKLIATGIKFRRK